MNAKKLVFRLLILQENSIPQSYILIQILEQMLKFNAFHRFIRYFIDINY